MSTQRTSFAEIVNFFRDHYDGYHFEDHLRMYPHTMPWNACVVKSHEEVKRNLGRAGSFYYSPDTMQWFDAKITDPKIWGDRFWIESIKQEDRPRDYRVCWLAEHPNGVMSVENLAGVDSLVLARDLRNVLARLVSEMKG